MAMAELLLYFTVTCALFIDKTGILAYHDDVWAMTKTSTLDYRLKRAGMVRSRQNESERITASEP